MLRAWVALLLLTGTAIAGLITPAGEWRLKLDASTESLIQRSATEAKQAGERRDKLELVAMFQVPETWTTAEVQAVGKLALKLNRMPGVIKVVSPFTARIPMLEADQVEVASLLDRLARDPANARRWIDLSLNEPLLRGHMVNPRGNAVAMRIQLRRGPAQGNSHAEDAIQAVRDFLSAEPAISGSISGASMAQTEIGEQIVHDLGLVLLLCSVIIPVVLMLGFQGMAAVWLPVASIVLALTWTLGAMAWLGLSLNLVTAIVPPLVMALTLAYSMHALSAHSHSVEKGDEALSRRLIMPLLVTGITTFAGFLALSLQDMPAIRAFSFAGAIGVVASLASVLLLQCYALRGYALQLQGRPWVFLRLQALVTRVYGFVAERRPQVIAAAIGLFVLGLLGMTQIEPGARYISDLPPEHPVRVSFDQINANFGGANSFEIVIEGGGEDAVLLPTVLESVELFQTWLNAQPEVGGTTSLVDYIKRLHQAFTSGTSEDYRLPNNFNLIKQLLIIGAPSEAERYASLDYSRLIIHVRTPLDEVTGLRDLLQRVETQIERLPTGVQGRLQGDAVELTRTVQALTAGQLWSFGMAVLAIYAVIAVVFASLRMGLRAMLPNLLPIAVYYGLIGLLGIPLSPTMALLACIVLGIAVDDTLFYLVRFNHSARRLADETQAAELALRHVIGPITLTTVALCLCFLTMTSSQFTSQYVFALLAVVTLLLAWVTDITLTPAIGARSSIVTLWDVLSVDLGTAPQETIPLFRDMSERQARIFALLSRIVEVPAGKCFIRVDDPAGDIYVIIEGEGYAWLEQNGQQIKLATFERGNTFGESSTFIQHRTANVSAVTDMRLLAFSPATLDRIRRRYPRIAALVYRNLSAIQARRLDLTTRKLEELTGKMQPSAAQSEV